MYPISSSLVDYLEQRNALTVIRALHHIAKPRWKLVKKYAIRRLGARSLSDYCYRELCKQLVALGYARAIERGAIKRDYYLTNRGHKTAEILEQALESVERWRKRAGVQRNRTSRHDWKAA